MEIRGERVKILPLKLEDAYYMRRWGVHKNPLLYDYNLPSVTDEEIEEWYYYKTGSRDRKYYSIFNEENRFIGYMGIKNIRKLWRDAVLGIVFDPNYVNKGYGTEAITTYLKYYFFQMGMKRLFLEVAQFNKRAIRCYEKCGFRIIDRYLREFFDQNIDFNNPYFNQERSAFVIIDRKVYNYVYKMKVDRKAFFKIQEELNGKFKY
ncbi:GNAT family N-acetyltransferase [Tepidimicrobium xylanilyticum]|uniref:GNAT family N-acetyltransferase n=1 Tax=Tepidimicrobium xylanilyticum TaxID=1123352 RepID=UPI002655B73F|nr:GNAT family N-acetyltransferase [Tepidimicrobium xylanilyticum]GMG98028.1 N-acetyltransferase [Tepidimicrobium xylanilyticum]